MIKKENILLVIVIIVLIMLNVSFLIYKICNQFQTNQIIQSENKNIVLSRITEETVTQGAIVSYKLECSENIGFEKSNIQAKIINSVNRDVGTATIVLEKDSYKILVDTSLLPAGIYKIKLPEYTIFSKDGGFVGEVISEESFKVILIKDG